MMLNKTNTITYGKVFQAAPPPETIFNMVDELMDAARAEGRLDAIYAEAKVIYDAVKPFIQANDQGRVHDAITRVTRAVNPKKEPTTTSETAALETSLIRALVFGRDARIVLRDVLDMLIGMSHPQVSSYADQRKWSPVMETIAHETDWPSLMAIVHWAWRETRPDAPEIVLAIGPSLEAAEKLESEVRAVLAWEPPTTVAEDKPPPISDPVRAALIAEARDASNSSQLGISQSILLRRLANALEDTEPLAEVPRDREMARRLVDAVWGYLEGDVSVPSTRVADKIIDQAVASPERDEKLIQRVFINDEAVYLTKGQIDLMRSISAGEIVALDDPRVAALKSIGMLESRDALTALTKRGREVVERLATRVVVGGQVGSTATGTIPEVRF